MQWDSSPHAGFTVGEPWLPISDDFAAVNVQSYADDPASILSLYRRLLQLRRSYPALSVGEYEPIAATGDLLAYLRRTQGERVLVALNLDAEPYSLSIDSFGADGQILLSTHMDRSDEMAMSSIALRPDEGVIISLSAVKGPRSS